MKEQPQHDIGQVRHMDLEDGTRFTFLGRAYDLDVYWNNRMKRNGRVVGPSIRHHIGRLSWSSYTYADGQLTISADPNTHVGVHHMCEMHRLIEENKDVIRRV